MTEVFLLKGLKKRGRKEVLRSRKTAAHDCRDPSVNMIQDVFEYSVSKLKIKSVEIMNKNCLCCLENSVAYMSF